MLHTYAPGVAYPRVALLTPGASNSAYFEHTYLARQMGIEIVRPGPARATSTFMRTTKGPAGPCHLPAHRRRFASRPDGLPLTRCSACRDSSGLPLAMLRWPFIGTGIADDKVILFVPRMIALPKQEPIIPNVPTTSPVRKRLEVHPRQPRKLVVKAANESGGYGMLMGPKASHAEVADPQCIEADPRNYIAQPMTAGSSHPRRGRIEGRHIDLRRSFFTGEDRHRSWRPDTRCLRKGSLVVSQGGGKDTWVLYGMSRNL